MAAMAAQARQRPGRGQRLHVVTIELGAARQVVDIGKRAAHASSDDFLAGNFRQSLDHAKAKTEMLASWRRSRPRFKHSRAGFSGDPVAFVANDAGFPLSRE